MPFTWPSQRIRTLDEFRRIVEPRLRYTRSARYLFRGQSSSVWQLHPYLARFVRDQTWTVDQALEAERRALDLFVTIARRHVAELERKPEGLLEWWSVMQHYEMPTRMLDWSADPFVALHFAARKRPDEDGAIWMVHPDSVQNYMRREYGSKSAPDPPGPEFYGVPMAPAHLFFGDVLLRSKRTLAQKGQFSWCRRLTADHYPLIADALSARSDREHRFRKIVIASELKALALEAVSGIGISDKH